jgi:zinc protease
MRRLFRNTVNGLFLTSLCALLLIASSCATAPKQSSQDINIPATEASTFELNNPLPVDPAVRIGTLPNGLTYYIRENSQPENRAELRLVVNAGSVLEDDDQQGLAHFLEHMAFNGTKNFKKQEIVNYLESIGMRFGPDLNAYTTFDETLYMLQMPTDSKKILETSIQILEEWAHNITFDETEIDKERGVIEEEWRLRRDADTRMRELQYPFLFYRSQYARRIPIGKIDIIRSFKPAVLERFYRDWYRPDLMAVVAVGDFDSAEIEALITNCFSRLERVNSPRSHPIYPVPSHAETLFAIATDPEATESRVSIVTKHDLRPFSTVGNYRSRLVDTLFNRMLNSRFEEMARSSDPPFLEAYSGRGRFVRSKEFYIIGAQVKENEILRGLEAVLEEKERIQRYGFTASELEREKKRLLKGIEQIFKERDKLESGSYAQEYVLHFLEDEPIPGIEYEYELYSRYIPEITLEEINKLADDCLSDKNRVVLVSAPEKPGTSVPGREELKRVFAEAKKKELAAYEDKVDEEPLLSAPPMPGEIVEERRIDAIGIIEWKLQNGVRVVLKPTDFKNNEVLFSAYSPGGHSLVKDEDYVAAVTADSIIEESGVGRFTLTQLEKKLAGKAVSVSPWISELFEGMTGSSTPEDMETMFQLIYLYFTEPIVDEGAFITVRNRLEEEIKIHESSPEQFFWDTIQKVLARDHYRAQPWTRDMLAQLDLQKSYAFYRDRFSDAGDFTFFFVGNFDIETIKPLICIYLGGLNGGKRVESWRNLEIDPPTGVVQKTVEKGVDPKSMVQVVFNGDLSWSLETAFMFGALEDVLEIPLRQSIREEQGGTYSIWVYSDSRHLPDEEYYVYIGFGCDPDEAEELTAILFEEIKDLKRVGPNAVDVSKVKEILRRERETNLRDNSFWLGILRSYYINETDPVRILEFDTFVEELNDGIIKKAFNQYLDSDRYVQITLYPEGWSDR